MNGMKPGWKTTEFWLAFLSAVAGLALVLGFIGKDQHDQVIQYLPDLVKGLVALAMIVWPLIRYIGGRADIKKALAGFLHPEEGPRTE